MLGAREEGLPNILDCMRLVGSAKQWIGNDHHNCNFTSIHHELLICAEKDTSPCRAEGCLLPKRCACLDCYIYSAHTHPV